MYRWQQFERPIAMMSACATAYAKNFVEATFPDSKNLKLEAPEISGISFDASQPLEYLRDLEIGHKPAWLESALRKTAA